MLRAIKSFLDGLASLKLTVFCLAFLMILTIVGTLYQARYGLFLAQKKIFYSFFFLLGGFFPFLGLRTLLWILFLNLFSSLVLRWRFFAKKIFLFVIHLGLLLLFVSAFAKFHMGQESYIFLKEGETSTQSIDYRDWEIIIFKKNEKERFINALDLKTLIEKKKVFFEDFSKKKTDIQIKLILHYKNSLAHIKGHSWNFLYKNDSGILRLEAQKSKKKPEENIPGIVLEIQYSSSKKQSIILYGGEKTPTALGGGARQLFHSAPTQTLFFTHRDLFEKCF